MLQRAETLVRAYGRVSIVINAAKPALNFYLRNGYSEADWTDVLGLDPARDVRVGKRLG